MFFEQEFNAHVNPFSIYNNEKQQLIKKQGAFNVFQVGPFGG